MSIHVIEFRVLEKRICASIEILELTKIKKKRKKKTNKTAYSFIQYMFCVIFKKFFQSEWLRSKSLQAINAGEGVEKREPSYTAGGNAN